MDAVILPIDGHPKDGVRLSDYLDFTAADAVELGVTLVHTGKDDKPSFHWYSDIAGDERKDAERAILDRPIRAALTAALAVAPKPRVKALEWEETYQARSDEDPNLEVTGFEANNGFGEWYWIETRAADFVLHIVDTDRTSAIFETEREAKAAAQADFERRILAALEDGQ